MNLSRFRFLSALLPASLFAQTRLRPANLSTIEPSAVTVRDVRLLGTFANNFSTAIELGEGLSIEVVTSAANMQTLRISAKPSVLPIRPSITERATSTDGLTFTVPTNAAYETLPLHVFYNGLFMLPSSDYDRIQSNTVKFRYNVPLDATITFAFIGSF
jgi:hypothetical protein